jgi:hypothetical protein
MLFQILYPQLSNLLEKQAENSNVTLAATKASAIIELKKVANNHHRGTDRDNKHIPGGKGQ